MAKTCTEQTYLQIFPALRQDFLSTFSSLVVAVMMNEWMNDDR